MGKIKNKYGQYFTIKPIADFMVTLISNPKKSKILEPSCGEGVFLNSLKESGYNNLYAFEIDTSLNNPFSFVRYESFVSSPINEKFDVIIGNPPYIRWKNLEEKLKIELEKSSLWKSYFNNLCDYLFIFILKSIEQLNPNGELVFICPEYWLNTTHSKSLRDYIIKNGSITEIYHFKEAPLFEGVTSSFIIFKYIKSSFTNNISLYKYTKKITPSLIELKKRTCFEYLSIPQFEIGKRWILASSSEQKLINSLEKVCRKTTDLFNVSTDIYRVGDFCNIGNGMVSGFDKGFCISNTENLNINEKACLIHVYKAKDLQQYYNIADSYYFFLRSDMEESEFKDKYPNIYEKLRPYKKELQRRYSYGKNLKIWEFAFPRNEAMFKSPHKRIFVPCKERISHKKHFRFAIADPSIYPLQDVTAIFKKNNCKEDIYYLLAYLNSRKVFEWLKYNGVVKGEIVEFSEAPIASIPFRRINWNNPQEVKWHDEIVEYTKKYIETKDVNNLVFVETNLNHLLYE